MRWTFFVSALMAAGLSLISGCASTKRNGPTRDTAATMPGAQEPDHTSPLPAVASDKEAMVDEKETTAAPIEQARSPRPASSPFRLAGYRTPSSPADEWVAVATSDVPTVAAPWWSDSAREAIREDSHPLSLSLEDVLVRALNHSSQIKVFSELPLIRETSIVEADAAFDWNRFLDTRWDDISDPVGNSLTVGGNGTRFNDHHITSSIGARRRTRTGGQLEMAQRFGWQDTNSTFFIPDQQGTARMVLSYTQPLMRGRGRVYNESLVVLAQIDSEIAKEEFERQLQSHLLEVVRSYWGLYLERGAYLQKVESFERAQAVYQRLQRRAGIDAFESQLISAEAEVKSRQSDLRRSMAAIRNAEDRVRSLVNDPELDFDHIELIPSDQPTSDIVPITMEEALTTAIQMRPEINQALEQIQAACVRNRMSKNELMPVLNLVTESYVSGLQGEGNVGRAFTDQFTVGAPSYSLGLQYEVPVCNRAAKARHTRRSLELRQLRNQYATTVQTLKLETRVAVREVETSFTELDTKQTAMTALRGKTDYILRRWELAPDQGRSGSHVLEDLLATQKQLAQAEREYLSSIVTYNLALMNLKRAMGMLLIHEQVTVGRTRINCLPTQILDKPMLVPEDSYQDVPFESDAIESGPPVDKVTEPDVIEPTADIEADVRSLAPVMIEPYE